jgi:hypothetical protein
MDPVVLPSARKHGVVDEDMLHAYRNPIRVFDLDDLTMLVGADTAGRLVEIGAVWPRASSSSSTQCPHARSS